MSAFLNYGITLRFAKAASEQFYRKGDDHYFVHLLEAQNNILDAASPTRFSGDLPNSVVASDSVSSKLDAND